MASQKSNLKTLPELDQSSLARVERVAALEKGSHIHVGGVCGTGMAAVASLLKSLGFYVSGSDKAFYPPMGDVVKKTVDKVYQGYDANNLADKPSLVVIGNNLRRDNPEVLEADKLGIDFASMPEVFAALLIGDRNHCSCSVVAAGTHGKTTTSAMVATLFDSAGWKPGYFIGGVPRTLPTSVRAIDKNQPLEKRLVVLEGDEYDSAFFAKWPKFHSYRPDILIVTSLEFDHADIYENLEQIEVEFTRLAQRVPKDGYILLCDCSKELLALAEKWKSNKAIEAQVKFYGEDENSSFKINSRKCNEDGGQKIQVTLEGNDLEFHTSESGLHNALNLLAAAAVGYLKKLSAKEIQKGLASFRSVKRRQEVIFNQNSLVVIEDFAHHPSAVNLTLAGIRERYPDSRIVAVFEPRSNTSRRAYFQEEYLKSFDAVDKVLIKKVEDPGSYSATSDEIVALDVAKLVSGINNRGVAAEALNNVDDVLSLLLKETQPGSVVVLMSNGDFGGLPSRLVESLQS